MPKWTGEILQGLTRALRVLPVLLFLILAGHQNSPVVIGKAVDAQELTPVCKNRVNISENEMHWLYVPESAAELHTEVNYAFLAGQLISSGGVDARDCPAGGLGVEGYANACGLARAKPAVILIQNIYDDAILQAWQDTGVPPVMLKQLLRYESQFWPGRWGEYHYGAGHLTYFGAHTALSWRYGLFQEICAMTGGCSGPVDDAMIYKLLDLVDATCPECPYKIDIPKAQRSIRYISEAVYAHCEQTAKLIYNATGVNSRYVVDYPTLWKLTLMNYNVGGTCVFETVASAYKAKHNTLDWLDITFSTQSSYCTRGVTYANQIVAPFYDFPPTSE